MGIPSVSFHKFSPSTAAILVREDEMPPDRVEGGVPLGWELTGEVIDFQMENDETVEVHVLERQPIHIAHEPYDIVTVSDWHW